MIVNEDTAGTSETADSLDGKTSVSFWDGLLLARDWKASLAYLIKTFGVVREASIFSWVEDLIQARQAGRSRYVISAKTLYAG